MKLKSVNVFQRLNGQVTARITSGARVQKHGDGHLYVVDTDFLVQKECDEDVKENILSDGFIVGHVKSGQRVVKDACRNNPRNRNSFYLLIHFGFPVNVDAYAFRKMPICDKPQYKVFWLAQREFVVFSSAGFSWKVENLDGFIKVTCVNTGEVLAEERPVPSQGTLGNEDLEEEMRWCARRYWDLHRKLKGDEPPHRYAFPPPKPGSVSRYNRVDSGPSRRIMWWRD